MKKFVLLLLIAIVAFASYSSPPSKPKVKPPNKTVMFTDDFNNHLISNISARLQDAVMLDDNGLCQCDHLLIKPIAAVQTTTIRPATYQQTGYSMAY